MSRKLPPEIKIANKKAADKKYQNANKEKIAAYQKQYKIDNPDKRKSSDWFVRYYLKKDHGITLEQKTEWLASQDEKCACCGTTEPGGGERTAKAWKIDHDHVTGFRRGILCNACNLALGYARDSVDRLQALINYLQFKPDYNFEVI